MSDMESLDKLQAELSGNVYGDAFHTLYKLSQDVSVEHSELMAQAMKWVRKEKVEPLEAENERLRSESAFFSRQVLENGERNDRAIDQMNAENAKLRELVKRMHRHIRQTCGECDGWYCSNFDEDNECCVYDTLARELGVEVN